MNTEIKSATYSILSSIRAGRFVNFNDLNPAEIPSNDAREIVIQAKKITASEQPNVETVFEVASNLSGGIRRFNSILQNAENAARQEMGCRADDDPSLPLTRAIDVLHFEAVRKRRMALVARISECVRTDNEEGLAAALAELQAFEVESARKSADPFRSAADFIDDGQPMPMLIDGIAPDPSFGLIVGLPKVAGKTTTTTYLAACIAGGLPWFGYPTKQGKVLIVAAEETEKFVMRRLHRIIKGLGVHPDKECEILSNIRCCYGPDWTLDSPKGQLVIDRAIQRHKPALVIFDPLARLFTGDENQAGGQGMGPFINYVKSIINRFAVSTLLVHHSNKSSALSPTIENMIRGTGDLRSAHDWTCGASPCKSGGYTLSFELRYSAPFELHADLRFSDITNDITFSAEVPQKQPQGAEAVDLAYQVESLLNATPLGLTRSRIRAITGKGDKCIKNILDSLQKNGRARPGRGKIDRQNGTVYTGDLWFGNTPSNQQALQYDLNEDTDDISRY